VFVDVKYQPLARDLNCCADLVVVNISYLQQDQELSSKGRGKAELRVSSGGMRGSGMATPQGM